MSSSITITCLIFPKHWSSLHQKTSPATVSPKGITVCLNLPTSVSNLVKMMKPHLAAGVNTFFLQSQSHYTCIHKLMHYVFRCLEIIWFPHNDFVGICRIQADSKLQISQCIFALNKHKAVYNRVAFVKWFQNSCFQHLINFLLESFFQVNWNWLTGGLLGCDIWIQLNVVWGTWEASNTIKYNRVALQNLLFTCYQLGNYLLSSDTVDSCFEH